MELEQNRLQQKLMKQRKQQTKKLKELVKKVENKKKLKSQKIHQQKENLMAQAFMTGIMPHTSTRIFLNPQLILLILKDVQV